jgi:N-glycosylase/DNA lyase
MSQFLDDRDREGVSKSWTIEAADFDLRLSMGCGQVFGWEWQGDWCAGVIGGKAVALRQAGAEIECVSEADADPARIASYLGLDEDYGRIMHSIAVDGFMKKAIKAARGLRILKQDAWPCLGSYILSSNNRVERIQSLVKELSVRMGEALSVSGKLVYAFPEPGVLASCHEKDIRSCGAGFRSPYLNESAGMIASGEIALDSLSAMPYAEAKETLKRLPGVGEKVADCVLLFAFSKGEAFPVDVWIKRAVERVYFDSRDLKVREIHEFAHSYFGKYAGYAQEYIYFYAREHGLE